MMKGRNLLSVLRSGRGAKRGKSAERGAAESVSHGNRRAAVEQVTRRSSMGTGGVEQVVEQVE